MCNLTTSKFYEFVLAIIAHNISDVICQIRLYILNDYHVIQASSISLNCQLAWNTNSISMSIIPSAFYFMIFNFACVQITSVVMDF